MSAPTKEFRPAGHACDELCATALIEECSCRCGGRNHGVDRRPANYETKVMARVAADRAAGIDPFAVIPGAYDEDEAW